MILCRMQLKIPIFPRASLPALRRALVALPWTRLRVVADMAPGHDGFRVSRAKGFARSAGVSRLAGFKT